LENTCITVDILYDDFSDAMNIWNMTEQRTSRPSHMAYTDSSIQNADVTSSDDDTNIQSDLKEILDFFF
jgi:hypothetical protein